MFQQTYFLIAKFTMEELIFWYFYRTEGEKNCLGLGQMVTSGAHSIKPYGSIKCGGNYWTAEQLEASHEGLSFMELDS